MGRFPTNDRLTRAGIPYESYLQNIGRQLFYVVSVSYITIYLAIIFLIVANTVLGVQFLTQQTEKNHAGSGNAPENHSRARCGLSAYP